MSEELQTAEDLVPDVPAFVKNMRYYMKLKGITQVQLAEMIGTSQSVFSTWMRGCSPSLKWIYRIRDALDISFNELLDDYDYSNVRSRDDMIYENHLRFLKELFPDEDAELLLPEDYQAVCEQNMVSVIGERNTEILQERYGLKGDKPKTYAQIGEEFGVTKQAIYPIIRRAMKRLRVSRKIFETLSSSLDDFEKELRTEYYTTLHNYFQNAERELGASVFGYEGTREDAIKEMHNIPLEYSGLNIHAFNALSRGGVHTVGDMVEMSDKDIQKIRSLGERTMAVISEKKNEILNDPIGWLCTFNNDGLNKI